MKIVIEINCDNAAFEDDFEGEVERILKQVNPNLVFHRPIVLYDVNGNSVGSATMTDDEE